jgi:hypothetical protein
MFAPHRKHTCGPPRPVTETAVLLLNNVSSSFTAVSSARCGSTVGIATDCELDDHRVRVPVPVTSRIFTSPYHPDRFWGSPVSCPVGIWGSYPGGSSGRNLKLSTHVQQCRGQEALLSTSDPPYVFMAWCLVKHRDYFTFIRGPIDLETGKCSSTGRTLARSSQTKLRLPVQLHSKCCVIVRNLLFIII